MPVDMQFRQDAMSQPVVTFTMVRRAADRTNDNIVVVCEPLIAHRAARARIICQEINP